MCSKALTETLTNRNRKRNPIHVLRVFLRRRELGLSKLIQMLVQLVLMGLLLVVLGILWLGVMLLLGRIMMPGMKLLHNILLLMMLA